MPVEALKGHVDLLILAALESGPAHGYALVDTLRERSGGAFDLAEGTVYPALYRLERRGLVRSGWEEGRTRRGRVYGLTVREPRARPRARRLAGVCRRDAGGARVIDRYLEELGRSPRGRRRPGRGGGARLDEVADHPYEAAARIRPDDAVRRFGPADDVARLVAAELATTRTRAATFGAFAAHHECDLRQERHRPRAHAPGSQGARRRRRRASASTLPRG